MGFIRNRVLRRFGPAARLADLAIVSNTALRFASRKGWVSEETAKKFGAANSSAGSSVSIAEIGLALAALTRVVGKKRGGKSSV